ncbi:MAG TPA: cobaltochelatase subunit CobN, partial [Methanobacterium sp.]
SYNTIVTRYPKLKSILDYVLQTLEDAKYTNYKGSEPIEQNYIAKHWIESTNKYINWGISPDDAGEMAITRIFAPPVGDYGAGVSKAVEQSWTWENREEVADVYINRMSHAYSERNWGVSNPDLFKDLLKDIDTAYHSRSTNLYGILDNDDYYDYYGGLSMAIEKMNNGKAPNLNVVYYANPSNPKVMSLQSFMTQEIRSRYYNPEWIHAMMKEGYSGARYMSNKFVSYLWGWQVTSPDTVENWMWDEVVNTYIKDQYNIGVDQWLSSGNNAYAMISVTGTLLTAANKGYWKTDEATLRLVANTWANLIAQNGVACCDCSCGNIAMMKWATQYINPDLLAQFKSQIYAATRNEGFAPSPPNPSQPGQPSEPGQPEPGEPGQPEPGEPGQPEPGQPNQPGQSEQSESSAGTTPGEQQVSATTTPADAGDSGQKAHEISETGQQSSSQTGMPIAAIVGILLIVGLIGVGYFRTNIMDFLRK